MKNSDFIIEWVEKLKSEMDGLPFIEDDIRKDFYGLINDAAYCYYRPYLLYEISTLTNKKKLDFGILKENMHVKAIEALTKNSTSAKSHFYSLNRNFILDAWSTFEICVNTFCEGVCNEKEIEKLLSHKYSDIIKLLPKGRLNDDELNSLKIKSKTSSKNSIKTVTTALNLNSFSPYSTGSQNLSQHNRKRLIVSMDVRSLSNHGSRLRWQTQPSITNENSQIISIAHHRKRSKANS